MLRIGQVESSATTDGKYTDGNVAGGIAATRLRAAAFNAIQEELAHIVESTGTVLDENDTTQVLVALHKIFAGNSDALGALAALTGDIDKLPYFTGPDTAKLTALTAFAREILAQTDSAGVLSKLRLGAGAPAIGIPFFWPSAAMPNTVMDEWSDMVFLKWNGATFSATEYPKLALVIPGLKLQETRGEFIRIWDDGRGVDISRTLLSAQQSSKLHEHVGQNGSTPTVGLVSVINPDAKDWDSGWSVGSIPGFTSSSSGSDLQSVRPRNVAFNFLVRAK